MADMRSTLFNDEAGSESTLNNFLRSAAEALADVDKVGPRFYKITDLPSPFIHFIPIACHGEGGPIPEQIVLLLDDYIDKHPEWHDHTFIFILLGDNHYPHGVSGPTDPKFQKEFYAIFDNPALKHLRKARCIALLGNHDEYFCLESNIKASIPLVGTPIDKEAGRNQIAETYLHRSAEFFLSETLKYDDLPKRVMPAKFNAYSFDKIMLQCVNGNYFIKDLLTLLRQAAAGQEIDPLNQAFFFKKLYEQAEAENQEIILAIHNQIEDDGIRRYPGFISGHDASIYQLTAQEIQIILRLKELEPHSSDFIRSLRKIFNNEDRRVAQMPKTASYSELLKIGILHVMQMYNAMVLCGNQHSASFRNTKLSAPDAFKFCQVTAAASGAKSHLQKYFGDPKHLGCYSNNPTGVIVSANSLNPKEFNILMLSLPETRPHLAFRESTCLRFSSNHHNAIRIKSTDWRVENLRKIILEACKDYFDFLHSKQETFQGQFFSLQGLFSRTPHLNFSHKIGDIDIIHHIINYLNHPVPDSWEKMLSRLNNEFSLLSNKDSTHSLVKTLRIKLTNEVELSVFFKLFNCMPDILTNSAPADAPMSPRCSP